MVEGAPASQKYFGQSVLPVLGFASFAHPVLHAFRRRGAVSGAVFGQQGHASGHRVHLQPSGLRPGCEAGERTAGWMVMLLVVLVLVFAFFFFFCLTFTFQLLDKLLSQVSSVLPPGTCFQFLSRIGFSIPTARRFSSNVANSRSRALRESICAREKIPTFFFYEYALGGTRTHAIDL